MTAAEAREISREMQDALASIADRHNLEVTVRGGSYGADSFRPKVEFKTLDAGANEWALYAGSYDLAIDDFGRTFTQAGRTFRISGVAPRSPKRPILADEVSTGRTFKFPAAAVRRALATRVIPAAPERLGMAFQDRETAAAPSAPAETMYGLYGVCMSGPDTGRTNVLLKTSKSKNSLMSYRSKNRINGAVVREVTS